MGAPGQPPLENGFAGAKAGFYKDHDCTVHLVGELVGESGSTAFTLPAGFRPPEFVFAAVAVGGPEAGNVEIETTGEVIPFSAAGGSANFGIDSVTFRAAVC